ncbi:MAG: MarR family winged helix-turn-helix transcriptional regulator [Roseovarius sp.]
MDIDPEDLPLGFLLNTVGDILRSETQTRMTGAALGVVELGILWLIDLAPNHRQAEYARFQRYDVSTYGRYIDKLEAKGFVARHSVADDRRAHALALTEAGRQALAEGKARALAAERAVIGELAGEAQLRAALTELLRRP